MGAVAVPQALAALRHHRERPWHDRRLDAQEPDAMTQASPERWAKGRSGPEQTQAVSFESR